jgi:UDP-N-acetylmuramyl pentapeptide phosphotransferase/UDP-N-acetylglucosamine-1-phosphate transferase
MILSHTIIFLALLLAALVYYRLANKLNIVDKPNDRSSHSNVTVRGGGILIPMAALLWWLVFDFQHTWMVLGIIVISGISMLDDIYTISSKIRFGIQFLAISMAFYDLDVFTQIHWAGLPFLYFIGLGIINAINFMDGINGITGLYGLVFLGSLLTVNIYTDIFDDHLIHYEILAICVFLLFNLRKKALMFAGDIGSISLAYLFIYFLMQWYLAEPTWTIILFLSVFGIDAFLTILKRLKNRENVLKPHRSHLYQLLANEAKKDHVIIALVYAILQMGVNFFWFILPQSTPSPLTGILLLIGLGAIYLIVKYFIKKRYQIQN